MIKKASKRTGTHQGEDSDLITQTEAADLLGKTVAAVNELVRRDRLRSVERFGKRLVYRSEVEAFERDPRGRKS